MSLTAHDILMDADAFRRAYPRWPGAETPPLTARELTDYPEALDVPRSKGTPSKTARQMSRLLAGEKD